MDNAECTLIAENPGDGCQLAMKLMIDMILTSYEISKDWKDLKSLRFVGKKPRLDFVFVGYLLELLAIE